MKRKETNIKKRCIGLRRDSYGRILLTTMATALILMSASVGMGADCNVQFSKHDLPEGMSWTVNLYGTPYHPEPDYWSGTAIGNIGYGWFISGGTCDTYPFTINSPLNGGTGIRYVASPSSGDVTLIDGQYINKDIYFLEQDEVEFVANPSEFGTISPSTTEYYDSGSGIPITATINTGYYFDSWSATGSISIENPLSPTTTAIINGPGTITATFSETPADPIVTITSPLPGSIFPINIPVTFEGTYSPIEGSHIAYWYLDNILTDPQSVFNGIVSTQYTFTNPGVYQEMLTVSDEETSNRGTSTTVDGQDAYVVVYDPNGGFVTGGGWIYSYPDACQWCGGAEGKATFGFVSKYAKGADKPSGETEFRFKAMNMEFYSNDYDWLVVSGAKAQFKGTGSLTINGDTSPDEFGFLLTATDGQINGGGGVDKFRIKIVYKPTGFVVYDNGVGAPDDIDSASPQEIGAGNIVIHKK